MYSRELKPGFTFMQLHQCTHTVPHKELAVGDARSAANESQAAKSARYPGPFCEAIASAHVLNGRDPIEQRDASSNPVVLSITETSEVVARADAEISAAGIHVLGMAEAELFMRTEVYLRSIDDDDAEGSGFPGDSKTLPPQVTQGKKSTLNVTSEIIHNRFAHRSATVLRNLYRCTTAPKHWRRVVERACDSCLRGRAPRLGPSGEGFPKVTRCGECVCFDICIYGHLPPTLHGGFTCSIAFFDLFSSKGRTYLLVGKGEAADACLTYHKWAASCGHTVTRYYCDNEHVLHTDRLDVGPQGQLDRRREDLSVRHFLGSGVALAVRSVVSQHFCRLPMVVGSLITLFGSPPPPAAILELLDQVRSECYRPALGGFACQQSSSL